MTPDICIGCGRPFVDQHDTRIYVQREVCRQSFFSPAEHDTFGPYCTDCDDLNQQRDAHDEERKSLRGYSDEELDRI